MDFEDLAKETPVGTIKAPEPSVASQVERVKQELENTSLDYLKTYVLSKAEEFERLRRQYEQQLTWAKDEMKRLGIAADGGNQKALKEGYKARDREWVAAIGVLVAKDAKIALSDGLVDIPDTLNMLKEHLSEKKS